MTLEQLEALRAARLDPMDLPHTTTTREARDYAAATAALDARIVSARAAAATLEQLSDAADAAWLGHLNAWRETLVGELLAIKSPVRSPQQMGVKQNLTLSIKCVDFGNGVFGDSGWELGTSRLGQLMVASGFEPIGADAAANYMGRLPWHGSIKEVERRMKETARRRAQAQQQLDSALMDDDERARQEARSKVLNEAYNAMNVVVSASGGLRVVDRDYDDVDEASLTDLQREALAHARAAFGVPVTK